MYYIFTDCQWAHVVAAGAARQVLHCCLLRISDDGRARDQGHLGPPAPHRAPGPPGHPCPCHQVRRVKYLISLDFNITNVSRAGRNAQLSPLLETLRDCLSSLLEILTYRGKQHNFEMFK